VLRAKRKGGIAAKSSRITAQKPAKSRRSVETRQPRGPALLGKSLSILDIEASRWNYLGYPSLSIACSKMIFLHTHWKMVSGGRELSRLLGR
jgi:hypothetical protein